MVMSALLSRTLFKQRAVYVIPPASLSNKATSLMQPHGGGITEARTGDKFYLRGGIARDARINNTQAEPLLPRIERN